MQSLISISHHRDVIRSFVVSNSSPLYTTITTLSNIWWYVFVCVCHKFGDRMRIERTHNRHGLHVYGISHIMMLRNQKPIKLFAHTLSSLIILDRHNTNNYHYLSRVCLRMSLESDIFSWNDVIHGNRVSSLWFGIDSISLIRAEWRLSIIERTFIRFEFVISNIICGCKSLDFLELIRSHISAHT